MAASSSISRRHALLLGGLILIALAVRLHNLGFQNLNCCDEPFSLALAQRPFPRMFELFGYEANGAIYSIVLWPLVRLSESQEMLRSPAVLAGVLAVPAVWWAGRVLAGNRVALMAAALMAVNPMAVFVSQFARPFSIVLAVASVTFASLSLALTTGRRRWWVVYVAAMALAGYAHATTPFALLTAHGVIVYANARDQIRPWLYRVGAFLLASLPLFVGLAIERSRRDPLFWLDRPGPGSLNLTAREFTAGFSGSTIVYVLTVLILVAVPAWLILRSRADRAHAPHRGLDVPVALWAWALVPFAALFLAAQITPLFHPYYIVGALPGLILLIALLVDRLGGRARWAALAALLSLATAGTVIETTEVVADSWRGALAWIEEHRRPGDRVLVDSISVFPVFGYYDDRYRAPNGEVIVDEWREYDLPRDIVPLDTPGGYSDRPAGPPTPEMIATLASGTKRLFVVLANYSVRIQGDVPNGKALTWARENCRVVEPPQVRIHLYLISGCSAAKPT